LTGVGLFSGWSGIDTTLTSFTKDVESQAILGGLIILRSSDLSAEKRLSKARSSEQLK